MRTVIAEFVNGNTQTLTTAGSIAFSTAASTYPKNFFSYDSTVNKISILQPGTYEIISNFNLIGSGAGNVNVSLYEGQNIAPGGVASATFAAQDDYENISIINVIKVNPGPFGNYAAISFDASAAVGLDSAICIIKKV